MTVEMEIMIIATDIKEIVILLIIPAMEMTIVTCNGTSRVCLLITARSKVSISG